MEVNGQLHAPAILRLGQEPPPPYQLDMRFSEP